jgi:hypothetical protein
MPNYVQKALKQIQHKAGKPQHALYQSAPIQYGAKKQYTMQESKAPLLDDKAKQFIQQVWGKFLFLGRAVDSTLLRPISAIASQSSKPTEDTMQQTLQLLDYLAMQEDAIVSYHASDMVLAVHSNTSYLSKPKAQSQAGGHFFISINTIVPPNNGAILNIAYIIKNIMSLATEAEFAGLYIMAHEAIYFRIILEELGHAQPPTPLQTDNAMAEGHVWPSGWVVRKVANGPGFEPSAKGGVSSEGPKLVFRIHAYVGAMTVWGSSYAASISFHSHIDYNKGLKIRGAQGPVCLPHAVLVSGSELCPTNRRLATFTHLNLRM